MIHSKLASLAIVCVLLGCRTPSSGERQTSPSARASSLPVPATSGSQIAAPTGAVTLAPYEGPPVDKLLDHCARLTTGEVRCIADRGGLPFDAAAVRGALDLLPGDSGCAVDAQGRVRCWGDNPLPTREADDRCRWEKSPIEQELEDEYPCRLVGGQYYCPWMHRRCSAPAELLGLSRVVAIAEGGAPRTRCALSSTGSVHCWGGNQFQQAAPVGICSAPPAEHPGWLGAGECRRPVRVDIPKARAIAVEGWRACAVTVDGDLYCWGNLGPSSTRHLTKVPPLVDDRGYGIGSTPVRQLGWPKLVQVAFDWWEGTCGLTREGTVLCLDNNGSAPQVVVDADPAVELSGSCVRHEKGTVACWRARAAGGRVAHRIPGIDTAVALDCAIPMDATGFACALLSGGAPYCWGWDGLAGGSDLPTVPRPAELGQR